MINITAEAKNRLVELDEIIHYLRVSKKCGPSINDLISRWIVLTQ
jgi:hypothetical protein